MFNRITESRENIEVIKKVQETSAVKLDYMESILLNKRKQNVQNPFDILYNKLADIASESHERDEELRKAIDILSIRVSKTEEQLITLNSQNTRMESHMRIALKDVSQVQTDVSQFKERIEIMVKDELEANSHKYSIIKLSVKQTSDLVNDVQKQANFNSDDIQRNTGTIASHQQFLEQVNRRITRVEQIKLDELQFNSYTKVNDEKLRGLNNKIADVSNNQKQTDNYLEKYQPFNAFCQLFEVLRLTLDGSAINKVKDYEEFRLKELYDIILTDKGDLKTTFNKQYTIEPAGYTFDQLSVKMSETKLQSKSKRFLLGRPSLSASIKLNDDGSVPLEYLNQIITAKQFSQKKHDFKQTRKKPKAPKQSVQPQNLSPLQQVRTQSESIYSQQSPGPISSDLRLQNKAQSLKDPLTLKHMDSALGKYQTGLQTLKEDLKGENQMSLKDVLSNDEEEEEEELDYDDNLNDAIEDLCANMHEDDSSLGIKNLDYLKQKLFDPEIEIITTKFKDLIKDLREEFHAFKTEMKDEVGMLFRNKQQALEIFSTDIEFIQSKMKEFGLEQQMAMQRLNMQIEKMQNMCNYITSKSTDPGTYGDRSQPRTKSDSRFSQTVQGSRPQTQQNNHVLMQNQQSDYLAQTQTWHPTHQPSTLSENKSRNGVIHNTRNILSNSGSKFSNHAAVEQLKLFSNQTLFVHGGRKQISREPLQNISSAKDDIHMHSAMNFNTHNHGRPQTASMRDASTSKVTKRMIVIPTNNQATDQSLYNSIVLRESRMTNTVGDLETGKDPVKLESQTHAQGKGFLQK